MAGEPAPGEIVAADRRRTVTIGTINIHKFSEFRNFYLPRSQEPLHLFAGKEVCGKCDRMLREKTGLDDLVTTT